MSKANGWMDGRGNPADGTRTAGRMGRFPGFRGMLAGALAGMMLAGGWAGEARGQGAIKPLHVNPEFRKWYDMHKDEEMKRREKGGKDSIPEAENRGFGLIPDLYDMSYLSILNVGAVQTVGAAYPNHYDLRDEEWVTAVKNQSPYGTCWAHATFGSLESCLKKSQGSACDFSENNLVNLQEWDYSSWWGGNALAAEGYLLHWGGPVMEEDDPYPAMNRSQQMTPAYHVQQIRWIPGKSSATDNDRIKDAVTQYGGLFVSYYHDNPFLSSNNAYYYAGKSNANHAVTIVGWDDEYPKENFESEPPGDGAYIAKNSWGDQWGENGYFYVSYYDVLFARSTMYAFCNATSTNNYGKVYEYDPLGFVYESLWDSSECKQWGANIFTATDDDTLAAVGFYALGPNTSYKISIYVGVSAGNPTSGTCAVSEQSGKLDTAGYFTIPLAKEVAIGKGKRFSVVVEVKTPGVTAPLGLEIAFRDGILEGSDFPTSSATAAQGQSFISFDGETWYDIFLSAEKYRPNFCCKVYTKSATAEKPTLEGIAILGGKSVESGKTEQYTCDATYSDNSKKEGVAATWSVVKGGEWARIDAKTGLLTAEEVAETQTVTIRAEYTEDRVTASKDGDVQITVGPPEIPTGVTASTNDALCVRVSWKASKGATTYAVYRGETDNPNRARCLYTANTCWYSDQEAVPGVEYWYFVKAKNGDEADTKASGFSAGAKGLRLLTAPVQVTATTDLEGRIEVGWEASEGATHYRVERKARMASSWTIVRDWTEGRTFVDETVDCGYFHEYRVSAALDGTGRMAATGLFSAEGRSKCPVYPSSLAVKGPDSLGSGETGEYEAFVVYTDGTTGTEAKAGSWSVTVGKAESSVAKGRVTAPAVTANTNITVSVACDVAYSNATETGFSRIGGAKTVTVKAGVPGKVTGLRVTSATAAGVGLAWDAAAGASGYVVGRTGGGGGAVTFKAAGTEYADATAGAGVEYEYTVSAENAAGTGEASAAVAAFIALAAPGGVTATGDRTDGVRVKWAETAGATHYRVGRAESESGAKTELGSWQGGREYLDTAAAAGKTNWYFVKAATGADGSHAGAWSAGAKGGRKAEKTLTGLSVSGPDRVGSGERAVYACEAAWNDGERRTVAAAWSAVGGEIGADGGFAAVETESDVAGRVVAAYGGMAATQEVTIVGAAIEATAEVSGVTVAQRWPFAGMVDIGYTLATRPAGTKAAVSVSAWDEDHGRALAARTLEGDGADGTPLEAGEYRLAWDLAADYPEFHAAAVRVDVAAAVASLAAPEGVTASGATAGITISWTAVTGATGYEVWRNAVDSPEGATRVGTAEGTGWTDTSAVPGTRYWYWVKALAPYGTSEFSPSASAVRPLAAPVVTATEASVKGIDVSWSVVEGAVQYRVLRGDSDSVSAASLLATVTGTNYSDTAVAWVQTYYYWVVAANGAVSSTSEVVAASCSVDLMPLRSLLRGLDLIDKDGVITDEEMALVFANPTIGGGMDADKTSISDDELDVLTRIQTLNADKTLIACVMAGNYAYSGITDAVMDELVAISAKIRAIKNNATFVPTNVTASQGNGTLSARVVVTWTKPAASETPLTYEVWRATSTNGTPTNVATVVSTNWTDTDVSYRSAYWYRVKAVYADKTSDFSGQAKGYWGDWCLDGVYTDLMPLRSLLSGLDGLNEDGVISDEEMTIAFNNPGIGNMDKDPTTISADELDVLTRIQALNADKDLISAVMRGDYTYAGMTRAQMIELQSISDKVKALKNSAQYVPSNVSASQGNGTLSARVVVTWTKPAATETPLSYEVWRATETNGTPTNVATVASTNWTDTDVSYRSAYWYRVKAVYADKTSDFSGQAKGYWGDWCLDGVYTDLMPLRSMLRGLDVIDIDGVITDEEMNIAFNNPSIGNLDGDPKTISADELDILTRIQALNADKDLISAVMRGNYTYAEMTRAQMIELQSISDKVKALKNSAQYVPSNVSASQGNGTLSARVVVTWTKPAASETPLSYEVWRATSTNGTPTKVATVVTTNWTDTDVSYRSAYWYRVKAVYADKTSDFSGQAKGYWGDWCLEGVYTDLMPLRSMLRGLDGRDTDGVITDEEMAIPFLNPTIGNIDKDPKSISSDELDVLTRIQALNADKDLISAVMRGDCTYAGMTRAQMIELQSISDKIRSIKNS